MLRLANLMNGGDYRAAPELSKGEYRLLWVAGHYDVPISGGVEYQGRLHWFQMWNAAVWYETESPAPIYLVVRLSDQQAAEETHWHNLFAQMVTNGWDYDDTGTRIDYLPDKVVSGSGETTAQFYRLQKAQPLLDLTDNEVVGWFQGWISGNPQST
jgi:hypothetical protein